MSDEKIQIEIQDKVAPSIETKLDGIAASARSGYDAIERMKNALRRLDGGALNALSLAHTRAQKAINDQALATQRLRTEEQRTTQATLQSATAQQRLQTAATQTASAQQALAAATARASAAEAVAAREAANAAAAQSRAASAALRLQQAREKQTRATEDLNREGEQLKRTLFPLYDAELRYADAVNRANLLLSQGAIEINTYHAAIEAAKGRLDAATAAQNAFTAAQTKGGRAAQIHRGHLTNLGFQLNDIAVSLASGQNPLVVLVQQGSQIAGIASQAGVGLRSLAVAAAGMLAPLVPVVALLGSLYAGIKLIASEATEGAGLKEYAKELGATDKEIRKLNLDTVTFGDTMRGLWKTIDDATGIGDIFSRIGSFIKSTFLAILKTVAGAITSIVALFQAGYDTVVNLWETFPNRFALFMAKAVNLGIDLFEKFVNYHIVGINRIIEGLNKVGGVEIDLLESFSVGRFDTSQFETGAKDLVDVFVDSYVTNLQNNQAAIEGFIAKWQANSIEAAKNRIRQAVEDESKKQVDTLKEVDVTVKKMSENVFDYFTVLQLANREISKENELLAMLPEKREVMQRIQQIENAMLAESTILSKEQRDALIARLEAQQKLVLASQAEAQVWEATKGARQQYIADLDAIAKLKASGVIGGNEAAQQLVATNPEFDFANTQTGFDSRVQQFDDMYARIEELRKRDLINEQTAAALRAQVWAQQQSAQLDTAKTFFGHLTQLQKSESTKMAAIGKAAAIAQAIIKTYEGATSAYASLAGIPYVGPALGAAAAGAAIAAGLANVNAIRSQGTGFMQGGYTGDGPTNAVAGSVHGQEYVMDAATTARLGVNNLDALRSGAASVQRGGPAGGSGDKSKAQTNAPPVNFNMPFTAVVVPSRESALATLASSEGKAVILETIEENGTTVARIVGTK